MYAWGCGYEKIIYNTYIAKNSHVRIKIKILIMAKNDYSISLISKAECVPILNRYHYLTKESKGFKSGYNYGLIKNDRVVGVCIFTGFPTPSVAVKFGYERKGQKGLFELSRLCIKPGIQKNEHNITSWFVSRCIRDLKKRTEVKIILSYADARFHKGTIYKALNFKYDGMSAKRKDFYKKLKNGNFEKVSRGKLKHFEGEWRERPSKHRFVMVF